MLRLMGCLYIYFLPKFIIDDSLAGFFGDYGFYLRVVEIFLIL